MIFFVNRKNPVLIYCSRAKTLKPPALSIELFFTHRGNVAK